MNETLRLKNGYSASLILALLPLFVALPVIALSWRHGFDGLYGQDAYAYYRYAIYTLRQNLLALEAPAPFFWPPAYPLLVALLSFILGPWPITAQIVSLVAGALVPVFTTLLAYELWVRARDSIVMEDGQRREEAWIAYAAGFICALTPQLWQSSAVSMPDTTALASATLGAWALSRYEYVQRGAWLALAAAALAFAMLTRMVYTPVAIVSAGYGLLILARQPRRVALAHAAFSAVIIVVVLSPILNSLLQRLQSNGGQAYLGHLGPSIWQLHHALQNEFVTGNGRQQYRLVNGLYYALAPAHRFFFTPLLAPLLLPGLWQLWKRRSSSRILLLGIWPLGVYILLVGYPIQNFRFALTFLPPLAIVLASGVVASVRLLGRARSPLIVALVGALFWMVYGGWSLTESFMVRKQANLATVSWVQQQIGPQAQLFTFAITLTVEQYTDLEVFDLYNLAPSEINDLLHDQRPAYLLLDLKNIEGQWADHTPGKNYRHLEEGPGLQRLGRHRQYTLFRIDNGE